MDAEIRSQQSRPALYQKRVGRQNQPELCRNFFFRTYQGERLVQEETEPLRLSYYTYPHLRALFLLTGLEIVEEYGSFERTPLDNQAEQMIFILKKSS